MKLSHALGTLGRGIKLAARLVKLKLDGKAAPAPARPVEDSRLVTVGDFGDNPGRLRMLVHLPASVAGRPLVVLLHGCGQDAAGFAADSGWTELVDRLQFALLLPEQAEANNAGRCFQWFQPTDTRRGQGEAASIAAMTRAAIRLYDADPGRVFVVGLSAGGAMAAAMLSSYPDLFAAGACVAGLPVGSARSGMQAMLRMASAGPERTPADWAALVRDAGPPGFAGPWPRMSVWQGQADKTVAPGNADLLVTQWRALHGLTSVEAQAHDHPRDGHAGGVVHRIWGDASQPQVELWSLPGFPHAYPSGARVVPQGRFVEPAEVDATQAISRFFGLD